MGLVPSIMSPLPVFSPLSATLAMPAAISPSIVTDPLSERPRPASLPEQKRYTGIETFADTGRVVAGNVPADRITIPKIKRGSMLLKILAAHGRFIALFLSVRLMTINIV
jgi:hypothetical protein